VHGQYYDLMKLLSIGGDVGATQYLFLGDYVDRGLFACEVVFYLYCLKLAFPKSFWLLRGNHECRRLTAHFTFLDECTHKYDTATYELFMASFDRMPIAAIVSTPSDKFFCVHGGLSPDITTLNEVAALNRRQEPPEVGGLCDLLWSDPDPSSESKVNDDPADDSDEGWFTENTVRGCSYLYGIEAVTEFLEVNRLTSIVRAHEAQPDGYKMHMMKGDMPRVITMFSAPNYCDTYKNNGAILKVADGLLNIRQFTWEPHPYMLPHFMNVFDWSLPFVSEKVLDILVKVLQMTWEEDGDRPSEVSSPAGKKKPAAKPSRHPRLGAGYLDERGGVLKKKVLALTKVLKIYKTLRKHNEALTQLKQLTPSHVLPVGLLRSGSIEIKKALSSFEEARMVDRVNERRPSLEDVFRRMHMGPRSGK